MKTTQLLRADCGDQWEQQTGSWKACDQGDREGISVGTERLWSGCGTPAVAGHIWPMDHSWISMSGCQLSGLSPVAPQHHSLAVFIHSLIHHLQGIRLKEEEEDRGPTLSLVYAPPLRALSSFPQKALTPGCPRQQNDWQLSIHQTVFFTENPYNKCIYCL